MAKYEQFFNETKKDLDNVRRELDSKINDLSKSSVKKSDQRHYATKSYVLTCGGTLVATLCLVYWYITPMFIKNENQQTITRIEELHKTKK